MPTYEYACSECHNEWEEEQSIKEDALKICPKCHRESAHRQISRGAGFILKGGGWYADLYSSSSNKGGSTPSTSSTSASSTASSSESKAAATPSGDSGSSGTPSTSS